MKAYMQEDELEEENMDEAIPHPPRFFDRLVATFGSDRTPRGRDPCPFCKLLPANPPSHGNGIPNAEYFFGLDEDLTKMDYERYYCSLYYSILDLHRVWVKGLRPIRKLYRPMCHEHRYICTEENIFRGIRENPQAFIHPDPLDPSTIARIRGWVDTCNTHHQNCQDSVPSRMPTRVLDVGAAESSQIVKLVETQGEYGHYIALSHCWGKSNPFITTRDNLEEMKRGFDPDKAPATFRDAITITRKLGIRYLWIDSLCIIQKDTRDWEIEASRMGGVYRNAYLTIAAEEASADEEGFLKPRPPVISSLEIIFETGHIAKVYLRPQSYDTYEPINSLEKDPLRSRGWTLQETYLSRRILKFYHSRIKWTCQECTLDEGVHDSFSKYDQRGNDESLDKLFPLRRYTEAFPTFQKWYNLVQAYSKRKLSFESDRLPALSGLASLIAERENSEYLAGIWWKDAIYGICWRTENGPYKKPDSPIAPSWSWASVNGPVVFFDGTSSWLDLFPLECVTFKDYDIQHRGANQFGQVDGGWIKLEAPLAPIQSLIRDDAQGLGGGDEDSIQFDYEDWLSQGDLLLLFLMMDERDSDQETRKDIIDLMGIVVVRAQDASLRKDVLQTPHRYKKVGWFILERTVKRGNVILKRLGELVKEVVLI